ncbi:hypothetical protein SAMN02745248_00754 [Hathewaya proteolytica DSM 3090]|uniref:Uncharacterized protein n=1 Tax=Hathewaya proteolytica DSM 3090 TaxID=1121331 RepID=A0A1M6LH13_9CLOT|nr:hypothetical protein SAMN02745248_00754 [Hathewaya proteolytica DSM 3090]
MYFFILTPIILIVTVIFSKKAISRRKLRTSLKALVESSGKLTVYTKINEQ